MDDRVTKGSNAVVTYSLKSKSTRGEFRAPTLMFEDCKFQVTHNNPRVSGSFFRPFTALASVISLGSSRMWWCSGKFFGTPATPLHPSN